MRFEESNASVGSAAKEKNKVKKPGDSIEALLSDRGRGLPWHTV